MTPNLIKSVAAACLAAALLPAQEVHDVIVRTQKVDTAKASSKSSDKHAAIHKKMTKIIERMSADGVSSAERKKLKKALLDIIGSVQKKSKSQDHFVVSRLADVFGDAPKKSKAKGHVVYSTAKNKKGDMLFGKAEPGAIAWVTDLGDGKSKKRKAIGTVVGKTSDTPHGAWLELAQGSAKKAGNKKGGVWVTDGAEAHVVYGHKAGGKEGDATIYWVQQDPKSKGKIVRRKKGDKIDAIAIDGTEGEIIELHAAGAHIHGHQGPQKSSKKAATRAYARLVDPSGEHDVVSVIETGDGAPIIRYLKAGDVKGIAKAKAKAKAHKSGDVHVYVTDDAQEVVHAETGKLLHRYYTGKQDPKKNKKKSTEAYQITVRGKNGKVHTYSGSDKADIHERVQLLLQGEGKAKKSKKSKSKNYTFEWKADGDVDAFDDFGGKSDKKKAKAGNFFTFKKAKGKTFKGEYSFDVKAKTDDHGRFTLQGVKAKTDSKGQYGFDVRDLKINKARKVGDGGAMEFEITVEAADEHKGRGALLELLNTDGGSAHHGALLKLLSKEKKAKKSGKSDGEMWATIVLEDEDGNKKHGKWISEISKDSLVKHLHGHGGDDVEVDVVLEHSAHAKHSEHDGHGEHGSHDSDNDDVVKMIKELRAEMRELRKMMAAIKKSLGAKATPTKARMLPTLIREEVAEPRRRVRVRRESRETR